MSAGSLRVAHVGIKGEYPRNRQLRDGLVRRGFRVETVPAVQVRGWPLRLALTLRRLARLRGRVDVVLVAEFSNDLAPATAMWCRWTGALHVVDLFTGQYETKVLDRGLYTASSVRGRLAHLQDALATRTADVLLCDTTLRGKLFAAAYPSRAPWVTVPVGVPSWAVAPESRAQPQVLGPVRVLYYGNYIPLHGVPTLVEALRVLARTDEVHATLVGTGQDRAAVESAVLGLPASVRVTFVDRVAERDLLALVEAHDVVLGALGEGQKASSVIPNKVWQALGLGAEVVTRWSPSYDELPTEALALLHPVPPADAAATALALRTAARTDRTPEQRRLARQALDSYVESALDRLAEALLRASAVPSAASRPRPRLPRPVRQ